MDLQKAQKLLNAAFRDRDRQLATAKSGEEYYHNRSKIKQTGAAAIDEINRFYVILVKTRSSLRIIGSRPTITRSSSIKKSAIFLRIPRSWISAVRRLMIGLHRL